MSTSAPKVKELTHDGTRLHLSLTAAAAKKTRPMPRATSAPGIAAVGRVLFSLPSACTESTTLRSTQRRTAVCITKKHFSTVLEAFRRTACTTFQSRTASSTLGCCCMRQQKLSTRSCSARDTQSKQNARLMMTPLKIVKDRTCVTFSMSTSVPVNMERAPLPRARSNTAQIQRAIMPIRSHLDHFVHSSMRWARSVHAMSSSRQSSKAVPVGLQQGTPKERSPAMLPSARGMSERSDCWAGCLAALTRHAPKANVQNSKIIHL
mmetsp:Transcript_56735/g.99204  ORF Transcript_56735/g.99204 Transcript_56735/m.99204 type:complete len:264 (+) Transcript_56735:258-1049(+)